MSVPQQGNENWGRLWTDGIGRRWRIGGLQATRLYLAKIGYAHLFFCSRTSLMWLGRTDTLCRHYAKDSPSMKFVLQLEFQASQLTLLRKRAWAGTPVGTLLPLPSGHTPTNHNIIRKRLSYSGCTRPLALTSPTDNPKAYYRFSNEAQRARRGLRGCLNPYLYGIDDRSPCRQINHSRRTGRTCRITSFVIGLKASTRPQTVLDFAQLSVANWVRVLDWIPLNLRLEIHRTLIPNFSTIHLGATLSSSIKKPCSDILVSEQDYDDVSDA